MSDEEKDVDREVLAHRAVVATRILFEAMNRKYGGDEYAAVVKLCDEILFKPTAERTQK